MGKGRGLEIPPRWAMGREPHHPRHQRGFPGVSEGPQPVRVPGFVPTPPPVPLSGPRQRFGPPVRRCGPRFLHPG